jgi:hypothetical protein
MKTIYKVKDSISGKFWNGNTVVPKFSDVGEKWTRKAYLERDLGWLLTRLKRDDANANIPSEWQVIEYELIETEKSYKFVTDVMSSVSLKCEFQKISWKHLSFYNAMESRGVMDDILFILKIKPAEGDRFITMEQIKHCRAQLRLIGVKTRSFREYSGMFGMINKEQAMRARLALDLESYVDVSEIRKRASESLAKNSPLQCYY